MTSNASAAPTEARRYNGTLPHRANGDREYQHQFWEDRSRIVLTPTAPPSILGLFGFFGATLAVGTNLAGWWGNDVSTAMYLVPFAMVLGGVAQFAAGMFAYRARDGIATAMHGTWGAFWIAWGIYHLLVATHTVPGVTGTYFPAMGFWFIALAMITGSGALAALAKSVGLFAVLAPLATGSGFAAAAYLSGNLTSVRIAGWLFVFAAGFAWYVATAMMLEGAYGRVILPLGKWKVRANVPGAAEAYPVQYPAGMPGSRVGQ